MNMQDPREKAIFIVLKDCKKKAVDKTTALFPKRKQQLFDNFFEILNSTRIDFDEKITFFLDEIEYYQKKIFIDFLKNKDDRMKMTVYKNMNFKFINELEFFFKSFQENKDEIYFEEVLVYKAGIDVRADIIENLKRKKMTYNELIVKDALKNNNTKLEYLKLRYINVLNNLKIKGSTDFESDYFAKIIYEAKSISELKQIVTKRQIFYNGFRKINANEDHKKYVLKVDPKGCSRKHNKKRN